MALGKHLIQAVPFVYALQCLTGKVDNKIIIIIIIIIIIHPSYLCRPVSLSNTLLIVDCFFSYCSFVIGPSDLTSLLTIN